MCVNTIDTMESLEQQAKALQSVYALQAAAVNNSLENDCALPDRNGLSLSVGGRHTTTDAPSAHSTGALLLGGYRLNEHIRLGAYVDHGVSSSYPTGASLERRPLWGVFGAWQAEPDGRGAQIKLAYARNRADLTLKREAIYDPPGLFASEPGGGKTTLTTEAASLVAGYGFTAPGHWTTMPYLGLRYTRIKANGYTEGTTHPPRIGTSGSLGIVFPLTYENLNQETTTLMAGVQVTAKVSSHVDLTVHLGLEHDVHDSDPQYQASPPPDPDFRGLTPIAFAPHKRQTRPVAGVGATYNFASSQQVNLRVVYHQEVFEHSETTTAYATYSIGF